ncbi:hypothetical protein L226DRAFT_573223 [Lentinus tigrinus ALCF2SS1-7]|uniref:uncharacterized protein n=1 Tax=Lentinus tigrinus ALCF2SS1-7 TaxID=1328758 RepID=UPI0011663B54|nr:hypothetical protein L226DRAFT_573223 [Lentinus tigrinus ALCF2SS1-7]
MRSGEENRKKLQEIIKFAEHFGLEFDAEGFDPQQGEDENQSRFATTVEDVNEEEERDEDEDDDEDAAEVERGVTTDDAIDDALSSSRSVRLERAGLLGNDTQRQHAEHAARESQRAAISSSRRWSNPSAGNTGIPPPYMRPASLQPGPTTGSSLSDDKPAAISAQAHAHKFADISYDIGPDDDYDIATSNGGIINSFQAITTNRPERTD